MISLAHALAIPGPVGLGCTTVRHGERVGIVADGGVSVSGGQGPLGGLARSLRAGIDLKALLCQRDRFFSASQVAGGTGLENQSGAETPFQLLGEPRLLPWILIRLFCFKRFNARS